ncbi:MAG: hypothetical protein MZV63_63700 [Marinilabiliales bacterium]|nr:hypothetical protein [Marinilabiliales bacterium]
MPFQMIPGFNVTQDIGPAAYAVRGLYGYTEGRTLMMIDRDGAFRSEIRRRLHSGQRPALPVHTIEKIESNPRSGVGDVRRHGGDSGRQPSLPGKRASNVVKR